MIKKITTTILLILLSFCSSCGYDPLTGIESPDGTKIAIVYIKRFDKSNTHVSIINKNESLPKRGNVAILNGVVPLSIEWRNDREVKLILPDSDEHSFKYLNKKIGKIAIVVE